MCSGAAQTSNGNLGSRPKRLQGTVLCSGKGVQTGKFGHVLCANAEAKYDVGQFRDVVQYRFGVPMNLLRQAYSLRINT